MKLIKILLFTIVFAPSITFACTFDSDCDLGSKCKKERGEDYGVCTDEMTQEKRKDQQPILAPPDLLDPNSTYGKKCSFDIDCGSGSQCLKDRNAIDGVCVGVRQQPDRLKTNPN